MNMQILGTVCPHCGAKAKAAPKAKAAAFDPWATKAENLRDHAALPPWQAKRRKRAKLDRKVNVRVVFADGETRVATTFFAKADGSPDVDAIVRAERESRIMHAAWDTIGGLAGNASRPPTVELHDGQGRIYSGLYLQRIPKVTRVEVQPFVHWA